MDKQEALARLQDEELDILLAVCRFCEENNIRWFIDAGSLLGAARHGGFIPWDDDIDISMLRQDYDRFIELAAKGFVPGYSVHTYDNTPGYSEMFAKVYKDGTQFLTQETKDAGCPQGIFIDIFPYDALSSDERVSSRQRKSAKLWQSLAYLHRSGHIVVPNKGVLGALERLACHIAHVPVRAILSRSKIKNSFDRCICSDECLPGDTVIQLAWPNIAGYRVEDLFPTCTVEFAGYEFPAPRLWEQYLEQMYGDWKKLPAPEDRKTHLPLKLVFSDGASWSCGC